MGRALRGSAPEPPNYSVRPAVARQYLCEHNSRNLQYLREHDTDAAKTEQGSHSLRPATSGKTTLVRHFLSRAPVFPGGVIEQTGDDIPFANTISQCDLHYLKSTIPPDSLLVIDEAQRIPNIGRALKLIVDNIAGVRVIVTGSSSFDLLQSTGESLTGKKTVVTLFPVSVQETLSRHSRFDLSRLLPDFLRFGMYPAVLTAANWQGRICRKTFWTSTRSRTPTRFLIHCAC